MTLEVLPTNDGSTTLRDINLDETFHSIHGAVTESRHVFIESSGLNQREKSARILEIGFGTGLNFVLTTQYSKVAIDYTAIETRPLPVSILDQLGLPAWFIQFYGNVPVGGLYEHENDGNRLNLYTKSALDIDFAKNQFDIVYLDAFSPQKCPELWSVDYLSRLFSYMDSGGVLVTYCAQGQFRRDLAQIGFNVERLPGPPGKKHMTKATKV